MKNKQEGKLCKRARLEKFCLSFCATLYLVGYRRRGYIIRSKEHIHMTEQVSPLATFYKPGWENYQHALAQTIAPLSSEQLTLPIAPHQRSIGELLEHLIGA